MKRIVGNEFGGERPLFASCDLCLEDVTVHAGESALKECRNVEAVGCRFEGKYPFWHNDGFVIRKCLFTEGARAALWYSRDLRMSDTRVEAPKMFREMDGVRLENVQIPNAQETLWHCRNVDLKNVRADRADYLFLHGENIRIEDYVQNGNYSFQYCRNVTIRDAEIHSKDAFWNSEDVTVYDSVLDGEYLGWHSKRLKLVNCRISGTQPLCYAQDLVMENCTMDDGVRVLDASGRHQRLRPQREKSSQRFDHGRRLRRDHSRCACQGAGRLRDTGRRREKLFFGLRAMEKYDFDTVVPRRGTNSYKWDTPEQEGVLPMWVADMDFRAAPCIVEALRRRVSHGVFGYTRVPAAYYDAVTDWFARRHGWRIDPHWILYTTGVVPALSAVIKALTVPGDRVIVQTPAYNCFYSSIRNNGCELLANRLRYEGGAYTIDFDDLETKASDPKAKLLLLCNPHNPVGRVWTREELRRLGEICLRHGVRVVADEIHCELTYEGHDYTPFASLSDDFLHGSVTCNSPSKAFNLAGMQIANIVSADADVRTGIDRAINDNEVCDVNPFGVEALMAAYDRGEEWLDRLREYLADNYRMLCGFFAEYLPQYPVLPLEGTYLVWIDCRTTGVSSEQIAARLLAEAKLMISPGTIYGPGGEDFIRLNIACPRSLLEEGLLRLRKVLGR